ncbi:MAG: sulfatase-like hydrolase/transferase, partial [Candidatus Methanosuratincola sp.]
LSQQELNRPWEPRRSADQTTEAVLQWLKENHGSPFFLWVHYAEPHGPYTPPPPYDGLFVGNELYGTPQLLETVPDWQVGGIPTYQVLKPQRDAAGNLVDYERDFRHYLSQYDGQIRFLDDQLKALVGRLKEWGIYDEALLIITADHGEALGENDVFFFHGLSVSLEQIRVPLLIKPPSRSRLKNHRISDPVSTIDLMPTVLALLGQEAQYLGLQGMSLLPFLQGSRPTLPQRYIFSEIPTQLSLIHGRFQLLYSKEKEDMPYPRIPAAAGTKLFDYIADPLGKHDLSLEHSNIAAALKSVAESCLKIPPPSYTVEQLSPQDKENIERRLKRLGYVNERVPEHISVQQTAANHGKNVGLTGKQPTMFPRKAP